MSALFSDRRILSFLGVWLILLCIGFGLIFFLASSPASASIINGIGAPPTATEENLWAYANVPKPAYTATMIPTALPAVTETPSSIVAATETPGSIVMEIVENPAVPVVQQPASGPVVSHGGSKYILVDISEQHMYVYEGDALVYSFVVSTGIENSTRVGTFAVQTKLPNAYASTWNLWMPNWLGIYYSHGLENGIHALPILSNGATLWDGYLGSPVSYGCVVLGTYEAQILYDWAEIGTPVEIQW
jgi:lipoprotein-anchoring transpeptidase ErfK/SrfK